MCGELSVGYDFSDERRATSSHVRVIFQTLTFGRGATRRLVPSGHGQPDRAGNVSVIA